MAKKVLKSKIFLAIALFGMGIGGFLLGTGLPGWQKSYQAYIQAKSTAEEAKRMSDLNSKVLPKEGFTLPISWGDLGTKLVAAGVIDENKFEAAIKATDAQKKILTGGMESPVKIDSSNSQFVVDLLWAIGLAQKSIVYTEGPLGTQYKSDQGSFASTGGWTLAKGDAVSYLNKFDLIPLTTDQQNRVAEIAKNVYRPCCDNPTWFPDCNHGMAALGAIEMMVSKNLPDDEIYKNILKLNSFWFPDTYVTTAIYFERQGVPWDKIDAKKVLGKEFSSASGASKIQQIVGPLPGSSSGGSCGA